MVQFPKEYRALIKKAAADCALQFIKARPKGGIVFVGPKMLDGEDAAPYLLKFRADELMDAFPDEIALILREAKENAPEVTPESV